VREKGKQDTEACRPSPNASPQPLLRLLHWRSTIGRLELGAARPWAGVRLLRLALAGGGTVSGCRRAAVAAGEEEEIAHKGDDEELL